MPCGRNPCVTPMCKGADWIARSAQPECVMAFERELQAFMRETGRRDVGKCAAAVLKRANAGECLFG